ncbi:MAG: ATP synthase F1 subunit delta [Planctomycetes bacterium]|nr:ATP synthase F1 subunit delta [Planctomycetota bacterium]
MNLLARRYAAALFALAQEAAAADAVAADLAELHAQFTGGDGPNRAARALLQSPDVSASERAGVLQKLADGRHQLVQNLIGVLEHRRRLEVLFDIHPEFRALLLEQKGEVEGVIESPYPIDAAQLEELTKVAASLCGKKVALTARERPDLLGGARLVVGNVLYDGSLKAALEQLRGRLMQASV